MFTLIWSRVTINYFDLRLYHVFTIHGLLVYLSPVHLDFTFHGKLAVIVNVHYVVGKMIKSRVTNG